MHFKAQYFPYQQTGAFSKIVTDYINGAAALEPFYNFQPDREGIKKALAARKFPAENRKVLVDQLQQQYKLVTTTGLVTENIISLLNNNTFTICTAHQPNIFTGHLYFIYKIIHAITLANELNTSFPDIHFVPVFYMGSEDADLEELGEVKIDGKKYQWATKQKGAVGRMKVDDAFIRLIEGIEGQLSVEPFGKEITGIVKRSYQPGRRIEIATFELVNELFSAYGLVVLLPDNTALKKLFIPIIKKELEEQFSHKAVSETVGAFPAEYKVQATGRNINLFYLKEDVRERIEVAGEDFIIANTNISFSKSELEKELKDHPERFSPNVILRPVYQETILPNIAFIGGGGELAYWLELKRVFEAAQVFFPTLVLRNSFLFINKQAGSLISSLGLNGIDVFKQEEALLQALVKKESHVKLSLEDEIAVIKVQYEQASKTAGAVDPSLEKHLLALSKQALKKLLVAEKKMLRAEKKKFDAQRRHIIKLKNMLFPDAVLQERTDNLLPYYAKWGTQFIKVIIEHSKGLQHSFGIITENEN